MNERIVVPVVLVVLFLVFVSLLLSAVIAALGGWGIVLIFITFIILAFLGLRYSQVRG